MVGIYSGQEKLGEGFGSSLSMAEFRVRIPSSVPYTVSLTQVQAAEDALQRLYLTRTPLEQLSLPSQTFTGDVFAGLRSLTSSSYTPGELGHAEVSYGSAGRSSIVNPSNRTLLEGQLEED